MSTLPTSKHAYFSAQAAYLHGSTIYLHENGSQVEVTCVCDDPDWATEGYLWKDKVYLGMVYDYVRQGRAGTFPSIYQPYLPRA